MPVAVNRQTGERLILIGGRWMPMGAPQAQTAFDDGPSFGETFRSAFSEAAGPQTVESLGGAARATGILSGNRAAGEAAGSGLDAFADYIRPEGPGGFMPQGVGDVIRNPAQSVAALTGMGAGSMVLPAAAAAAGAATGSGLGPAGTAIGGAIGALGSSYALNFGENYNTFVELGANDEQAARWAAGLAAPQGVLDSVGLGRVLRPFRGAGLKFLIDAGESIPSNVFARIAKGAGISGAAEATTEMAQAGIQEAGAAAIAPEYTSEGLADRLAINALGGAAAGAPIGAVTGGFSRPAALPADIQEERQAPRQAEQREPVDAFDDLPAPPAWQPIYADPDDEASPVTGYVNPTTSEIRTPEEHLAAIQTPLSGLEPRVPDPAEIRQAARERDEPKPTMPGRAQFAPGEQPKPAPAASIVGPSGTVPEPPEQIAAQAKAYAAGQRGPVFVDGAADRVPVPDGMVAFPSRFGGSYIVRPEEAAQIRAIEATTIDKEAARARILGYQQTKDEALAGRPVAVQAKDAEGNVVAEELVDADNPEALAAASESKRQMAEDIGGLFTIVPPDEAIRARQQETQTAAVTGAFTPDLGALPADMTKRPPVQSLRPGIMGPERAPEKAPDMRPEPEVSGELPEGWSEASPGGIATSGDPEKGGVVDKAIATGEWFAIPNNQDFYRAGGATKLEGFGSRAEAIQALQEYGAAAGGEGASPQVKSERIGGGSIIAEMITVPAGAEFATTPPPSKTKPGPESAARPIESAVAVADDGAPTSPRVIINRVGRDGLTDAERGGPLPPASSAPLTVESFSDKAIVIKGETKANKDRIKAVGGARWNRKAGGWIFPKKREAAVREALADLLAAPVTSAQSQAVGRPVANGDQVVVTSKRSGKVVANGTYMGDDPRTGAAKVASGPGRITMHPWDAFDLTLFRDAWAAAQRPVSTDTPESVVVTDPFGVRSEVVGKKPATKPTPQVAPIKGMTPLGAKAAEGKELGKNNDGETIYEDKRGARYIVRDGVRRTEPVRTAPVRGADGSRGIELQIPTTIERIRFGRDEFVTTDEAKDTTAEPQWWSDLTSVGKAELIKAAKGTGTFPRTKSPRTTWRNMTQSERSALDRVRRGQEEAKSPTPPVADARREEKKRQATEAGRRAALDGEPREAPGWMGEGEFVDDWLAGYAEVSAANAKPAAYGSANKLVTADRAAELRDRLKKRLKDAASTASSGIDPMILAEGTELAVFHIEAGARQFAGFAKAMMTDLGMSFSELRPYLRSWYNGARDMMEDAGLDVAGMDAPETVAAEMRKLAEPAAKETESVSVPEPAAAPADDRPGDEGQGAGVPPATGDGGEAGSGDRAADGSVRRDAGRDQEPEPDGDRPDGGLQPAARRGSRSGQSRQAGDRAGAGDGPRVSDYRAEPGSLKREGSWQATAERNIDIVELVNRLEAEGRPATTEEQAQIAKFTGWGASEIRQNLFRTATRDSDGVMRLHPERSYRSDGWKPLVERAAKILEGEDLDAAMRSSQYAHYTSEPVIRSIWAGVERMGFKGGRILEPGMGSGLFAVAGPAPVLDASKYTGIEFDKMTAAVAKALLPNQNVLHADYVAQKLPDGFFDVGIGNPPFARISITQDPAYRRYRFSLHDYFFAKTIDKVRPGGLLVFVTSRYTMDKADDKARAYLADRADLLGAIRMPQTAFKQNAGTEVVTDVLFLRKRIPGEEPGGHPWRSLKEVDAGGEPVLINEFFVDNPANVLGSHSTAGSMYRENEYTVLPPEGSVEDAFAKAVATLPENVMTEAAQREEAQQQARTIERDFNVSDRKEGSLYVSDAGAVMVVESGSGVPVGELRKLSPKQRAWLKDYVGLRDAVKVAHKDQLTDGDWQKSLKALNKTYDAFVKKHGRIKEFSEFERESVDEGGEPVVTVYRRYKNDPLLRLDVEHPLIYSLEAIGEDGTISKGRFLLDRTLDKPKPPKIETAQDAMMVALDQVGRLDLGHIAGLLGSDVDQVIKDLGDSIYQTPEGEWQTADEYLSGDVRAKLEQARVAADADPTYERNVKALIDVQPRPLAPQEITVSLGSGWVPAEVVNTFADDVLGIEADATYEPALGKWTIPDAAARSNRGMASEWGTKKMSPYEILSAVLNNREIKVKSTVYEDGKPKQIPDPAGTQEAQQIATKMRDRFRSWVWTDGGRAKRLAEIYNTRFNNIAPRRFDGSHLTTPGLSLKYSLHPHQKRAIWRIIQTGDTYLGHAVGAGKTLEMIVSAMEQRRLGMVRKPLFVVPNHMLNQFASEFIDAYPAAQIMVADEKGFHTDNRRRFIAQATLNDLDAIIITHSSFGKLDTKPESRQQIVQDMIAEIEAAIAANSGQDNRIIRRKLEAQKETIERRFLGKTDASEKDQALPFEEMGIDFLYLDEAHEFRKLDIITEMNAKGITPEGSKRALDLYIKTRWLQAQRPGRSMVFASGTPVTNTMGELHTVMRFMDEAALEADGLKAFDAWATQFGEVASSFEQNAAGQYESVARFAKFNNVPELMARVRSFMDVLTSNQLRGLVNLPDLETGSPQNVVVPVSDALKAYMRDELAPRIKAARDWKPSPQEKSNPDPLINIITDARLSAIDMRFADPSAPDDPNSKLNRMIDGIIKFHKDSAKVAFMGEGDKPDPVKGAAQIVFSSVGFGEMVAKNRGFDVRGHIMRRLRKAGVKASEVAWMSDFKSHAKKQALFKEMREGKVRILFGSPKNMGTGLNVQKRLRALHYLSPPWYPSDVEQPHGRILRQGNQNKNVDIFWYATKGTYDSTAWGMVARKARFIEQAFTGDATVRTIEDISETSQYEMASAMAAGDERMIQLAGLSSDVERLTLLREAHFSRQQTLQHDERRLTRDIKSTESSIATAKAGLKAIEKATGPRRFEIGSVKTEKPTEATAAIATAVMKEMSRWAPKTSEDRLDFEIGTYAGLAINGRLYALKDGKGLMPIANASIEAGPASERILFESRDIDLDALTDGTRYGVGKAASDWVNGGLTRRLYARESELDELRKELATTKKQIGAPFEFEAELAEKVAERERLQAEMLAEGQELPANTAMPERDAIEAWEGEGGALGAGAPRFSLRLTDNAKAKLPALERDLRARLERLGIADKVALRVVDAIRQNVGDGRTVEANAMWLRGAITVALDGPDALGSLNHEVVHALREFGMFTGAEWKALERAARADSDLYNRIRRSYDGLGLTEAQIVEEVIAEQYRMWADGRSQAGGWMKTAFGKVRRFFQALGQALRGQGFTTPDAVFERVESGSVGGRDPFQGEAENAAFALRPYENVDDRLMGFRRSGENKGFADTRYRHVQPVRVEWPDGDVLEDEIKGTNRAHALERARRNWPNAEKVEAIGPGRQATADEMPRFQLAGLAPGHQFASRDSLRDTLHALDEQTYSLIQSVLKPESRGRIGHMLDKARFYMQDRMIFVRRAQEAVERNLGRPLRESERAYLQDELLAGRVGEQKFRVQKDFQEPILELMHEAGLTLSEVDDYLYALHAEERNQQIASINPDMPDGGSGITTADARKHLRSVPAEKRPALEEIAGLVHDMMERRLDTLVETGILAPKQAEAMRATYEHYVPLRGKKADPDEDVVELLRPHTGRGYMGSRRLEKRATGRFSEAPDILGTAFVLADEAIVRGEKNRVGQSILRLATAAPDPNVWKVNPAQNKAYIDKATGQVRYKRQTHYSSEDTMSVRVAGQEYRIQIKDPALLSSIKQIGGTQQNAMVEQIAQVTQVLSRLNTMWNPEFVVANASRDIQTALINLGMQADAGGIRKDVVKSWVPAYRGVHRYITTGKADTEWSKHAREFREAGGQTSFNALTDVESQKKTLENALGELRGDNRRQAMRALHKLRGIVEPMNDAVDNAVRLGTFVALRNRGVSAARAASIAKNLTVNFNRRGALGPTFNAFFMFFNAAVQGTAVLANAMRSPQVRKLVGAIAVAGAMQEIIAGLMPPPDDDDEEGFGLNAYDRIPEWVKERNLIIPYGIGAGEYLQIPMPYGYNWFHNLGRLTVAYLRGAPTVEGAPVSLGQTVARMGSSFAAAMIPPGLGDGVIPGVPVPSAVAPFVEVAVNQDWTGRQVMPERFPGDTRPDSQVYFNNVSPISREVADLLNNITGGNAFRSGMVDVSPESIDHVVAGFTGAAGAQALRAVSSVSRGAREALGWNEQDPNLSILDVPFVRKVVGYDSPHFAREVTYRRIAEVETLKDEFDLAREQGERPERQPLLGLAPMARQIRRQLSEIRKQRQAVSERDDWPVGRKREQMDRLAQRERELMTAFNRRYLKVLD